MSEQPTAHPRRRWGPPGVGPGSRAGGALGLLMLAALVSCGRGAAAGEPRGVLLVTIDGLRADHLGCGGYDRETSPHLDALALEGIQWERAFSSAPLTVPSHIGLLTGVEPYLAQFRLRDTYGAQRWRVVPELPSLAVEFLAAGWKTAAFLGTPSLGEVPGLERGFQDFVVARRAFDEEVVGLRRVLSWIQEQRGERWFVVLELADLTRGFDRSWNLEGSRWDGYFEPRASLDLVPPVASTDDAFFAIPNASWLGGPRPLGAYEAIYDGEIRRLDERLGELISGLRRIGLEESTTLIVAGTTGLQFGEAGLLLRSGLYADADLAIPLLIRPRLGLGFDVGRRLTAPVSLLDLAPTLLEAEGIALPAGLRGVSRVAELRGTAGTESRPRPLTATCGLLGGGVVIDGPRRFEVLLPGQLSEGTLRRSWFGNAHSDRDDGVLVRAYDLTRGPVPPPEAGEVDASFASLEAVAQRWLAGLRDARILLQGTRLGEEEIDSSRRARLVETGYLGEH